jgi:hypothetical protein
VTRRPRPSSLAARIASGTGNPQEVQAWADELPDRYLLCRDLGHTWKPFTARWDAEARAYVRELKCSRCKAIRSQHLDAYGSVVSGGYDYPDGYQAPAGTGRITGDGRGALRLSSTLRLIDKFGED